MKIKKITNGSLELKNDGHLELIFLGVGSAFTKRQFQTNLLIIKGNDHLLIDIGTLGSLSLNKLGLSITNIENFLITHSHADHIGGLEEAALMGRYVTKKKPKIVISEAYQHILWNMSLRGGCEHNEEEGDQLLGFADFFEIIRPSHKSNCPRETLEANVGNINIKMMRTKHIPDSSPSWESSFWSTGVVIDDKVFFTGDTRYDPELVTSFEKEFNFEAIFHDCQFFTGGVHASIDELNNFDENIKSKMYLVHYGDNWEDFDKMVEEYKFAAFGRQHVRYIFD